MFVIESTINPGHLRWNIRNNLRLYTPHIFVRIIKKKMWKEDLLISLFMVKIPYRIPKVETDAPLRYAFSVRSNHTQPTLCSL